MTSAQSAASRSRSRPARKTAPFSRLARAAIALAVCAALDPAYAQVGANTLPQGPRVNTGAATVGTSGSKMTVTQTTPKVSLGWESFSIGSKSSVTFVQPSSSSVALNRVLGSDPSWIYGSLSANGKVFLINQAGVLFAPGARVNVGGIAASTLDMSDTDFMAGRYVFSGDSTASVVNRGSIITAPGGYAALIGNNVANEGTISASGGAVALAAGSRVTMDLTGDGLLSISVDAASVRAMASNTGLIQADGGRVILSARAADALAGTVLNQTGVIEARSGSMRNGEIVLDGGTGGVNVAGTLDASGTSSGQGGGSIAIRGGDITSAGTLRANAGDNATAGSISVVAGGNLTLEGTSRIEARGANVMSQGGNIYLYASNDATANAGQVINFSGGTVSGDGGSAEFSAGRNGSLSGTLIGNAAPGYRPGRFLMDPLNASLSNVTYAGGTFTIQAEDNITVDGNVTIGAASTLTLLADHDDNGGAPAPGVWDMAGGSGGTIGLGTITRSGAFTISGTDNTSALVMWAGGSNVVGGYAIGTAATPILTAMNGGMLTVNTSNPAQLPGGNTNISNTGAVNLVNVNAIAGANLNNFTLTSTSDITVNGAVSALGSVALTSTTGSILDPAAAGLITAASVNLTAGVNIGAAGFPVHLATPVISLNSQGDVYATTSVAISDLSLSVNPGTGGTQIYSVLDTAGTPGLAATFDVQDSGGTLLITDLKRAGANNVNFSITSQTGSISIVESAINAGSGNVSLTATLGSILDQTPLSDTTPNITTTGALTLIAQGSGASIGGSGGPADINISGPTNITLRTNNDAFVNSVTTPTSLSITADPTLGAVNYGLTLNGVTTTITEDLSNNLLVSGVASVSPLNFSLTAPAGNIQVQNSGISLPGVGSNVVLTAAAGAVTDQSAATSIILADPTSTLTLSAATGIGQTGAGNELNTQVPLISLTASGGPINLSNTGSLTVTAFSNTGSGATAISTTGAGPNALTIATNMVQSGAILLSAGENTSVTTGDHLTVNTGVTIQSTGGSVILAAGDNVVLSASSVIQSNTGLVSITAGASDNDTFGAISMGGPSTVNAATTATLTAIQDITVSSLSAGTNISITSTAGSIKDDANDTSVLQTTAPSGSVSLSAVTGSIGTGGAPNQIDTQTAALTADVGGDLFVDNTIQTLTSLNLTLRPGAGSTQFYDVNSPGIAGFNLQESPAGALRIFNIVAAVGNDLALSITNASATDVSIETLRTNAGAATVVATGGNMTLQAFPVGVMTSGPATLTASGLLTVNGPITSSGANLTGNGVTQGASSVVNAGTGDILVNATLGTAMIDGALQTTSASATAVKVLAATGISQAATGSILAAGDILLNAGTGVGGVTLAGSVTTSASSASAVTIIGKGITQTAGTINGGSGSILIDANDGAVSMSGLTTTTSASATAVSIIDATSAALGNITATNGTVTLGGALTDAISGDVTQAGTKIIASNLAGNVGGLTTLTSANQLGSVGSFTSGNNFTLVDNNDTASAHNTGLIVTGPVTTTNVAQNIDITVNGNNTTPINLYVDNIFATGNVTLTAANAGTGAANILEAPAGIGDPGIDVTGFDLTFNAKTNIGEPPLTGAGPIEVQAANMLTLTAGGPVSSVTQFGPVTLGPISAAGDFTFAANGTIIVGAPMAVNGNTLLQATGTDSNIIVRKPMTRINEAAGTVKLEADNHIIFKDGADFVAATLTAGGSGATAVTLNSDHDASGGGAIYINAHSVIHSNNGAVVFGGGSGAAANAIGKNETVVGNLMTNGIVLEGKINAGTGNVTLRGQSFSGDTGVAGVIVRDTNVGDVSNDVTFTGPFAGAPPSNVFVGGAPVAVGAATTFSGSGDIATTTGSISIAGFGDQGTGNTQGVLITASDPLAGGTTITTVSGAINIGGTHVSPSAGGNTGSNVGVLVNNGAVLSSTDTANTAGAVTIAGAGSSTDGNADNGVVITSAGTSGAVRTTISVDGAALNVVGLGGGGGGADFTNMGVRILGGADVKSIGTGKVTLTGTGGATNGGGNLGIQIAGENLALTDPVTSTVVRSTSTAATALRVDLIGTGGAGTGAGDGGILIGSNARILTATGNVAMTGVGGAGSGGGGNNFGVEITTLARVTTTSSGSIAVTGTGGLSDDGNNYGVKVTGAGVVESLQTAAGAGAITFTGTGGAGSGPSDTGIFIDGASSKLSTTVGNIVLTGTGGGGATTNVLDTANFGVHVSNGAVVETLGAAQVTLDGTGSATADGGRNFGVFIDSNGVVRSMGITQTGTEGKIKIIGHGGLGTGAGDGGIGLQALGTVSTVDAEIEFQGTGGAGAGGQSFGVFSNGGIISTSGDGNILITGVGGASAGGRNYGIFTVGAANIESTAANAVNPAGTITLSGTAGVGGNDDIGINITSGTTVTSLDGKIDLFGTGTGTGTGSHGVRLATNASIASTGLAVIEIDGLGAAQGTGGAIGILLDTGAAITSAGPGIPAGASTITLTGTGGSTGLASSGDNNYGIQVNGTLAADTKITSVTGNILLTGTGGGKTGTGSSGNAGIKISGGADIETTGAAKVDLIGQSGITDGPNNYGVWITDASTSVSSSGTATSDITINGTGRGTGMFAHGVVVSTDALVKTTGAGDIAITGIGSTTGSGDAYGIWVDTGAGITSDTGVGKITLTGIGGGTAGSGDQNFGVMISGTGTLDTRVTSVSGNILIDGTGGGTGGSNTNFGVLVVNDLAGGPDITTTGAAKIDILGQSGITSGVANIGVIIIGDGTKVSSTGTATSDITITGNGRGTGASAIGVVVVNDALVTTTGAGDIAITGIGSSTGGGTAYGILVDTGAGITSDTGAGKITLTGTGGATAGSGDTNYGVWINGTSLADTRVTSVNGNILIDGTGGGAGAANSNIGVLVSGAADIATTGAAKVDILGQSGITSGTNNIGVQITGAGSTVQSTATATATGDINITGTGRGTGTNAYGVLVDGTAQISTQGAGDVTIIGTGATAGTGQAFGIWVDDASVFSDTGAGKLTLTGTGGGTAGSGDSNYGIVLSNNAQVTSVTGDIALSGTGGGTGAASGNYGVFVSSGSDVITTGAAKIDIVGQSGITSGSLNGGVVVNGDATVQSTATATATGDINITGTGRGTGIGAWGVFVDGGATQVSTQGAGDVTIIGTGATAGTGAATGILLDSASVFSDTGAGKLTLTGIAGGTAGSGDGNIGIYLRNGAQVTSVTGDIALSGTGGGTGASNLNKGVVVASGSDVSTTGAAKVDIIGLSGITSGTNNYGVQITGAGSTVQSTSTATATGDINITGTGRGTGTNAFGVLVDGTAQVSTQGAGDVTIIGTGATAGTGSAVGIQVDNASVFSDTGAGKLTLTGTGGGTTGSGDNNHGINLQNIAQVTSVTGDIALNGTGGGTGADNVNTGVLVQGGSDVITTGAAKVDIIGQSGITSGNSNYGVHIVDAGSTVQSTSTATATGDINITGTGRGTGPNAVGVLIDSSAQVLTQGAGDVTITGTGATAGATGANGIVVDSASIVSNTGAGKITLTGTGGGTTGSGDQNVGVILDTNAQVTSVTGDVLLTGTGGGTGAATGNIGVIVSDGADVITTGAAKIDIIGQSGITSGTNNFGVQLTGAGSTVQSTSTATATGDINITGTGRGTGTNAFGVQVDTSAQVLTQGAGDVTIIGTGATAGTGNAVGIKVDNASVFSDTGAGLITLTGTGGGTTGSGDNNFGVNLVNTAQVSSVTGNIAMTGTGGGTGASISNVGVRVASGSDITTTGAATITVTGTGGNTSGTLNDGVLMTGVGSTVQTTSSAAMITGTGGGTGGDSVGVAIFSGALAGTATGSVTVTGTGSGADAISYGILMGGGTVQSTASGSLALIGNGLGVAADIFTSGGGNTIGNAAMTGEILLRSLGSVGMVSDATILNDGSAGTVVTLNAEGGGGFNQTAGSVTSDGLRFLGSGTFSLTDPGGVNAVNKIAGTLADTSAVTYVQAGAVQVASLTSFQDGVGINQTTSNGFDIAGVASSLSIASGGITQASNAPIVVPGTTTLIDGGNNIVLNNPGNLFGTVNVDSANNVTLGGTSIGLGNVFPSNNLTINAGTLTDSGTVIVPGLATFNVTGNMLLDSPNSDFNKVTFNVGGDATLVDVNDLVVNTSTIGGNLALTTGGSLNTTPFNIVTVGGNVTFNVGTGGLGTLNNDFHLNTPGTITLTITGTVPPFTVVSGFVVNDGSGLLVLLPPTQLVRFNVVEFQPPTPVTAAMYVSKEYADVSLEDLTDLIYVTDDPNEQEYPGVRGRIGRVAAGADVHRDGGIRMPPGLVSTGGGQPAPDAGFEPVRGSRFLFRN